MIQANISRTLPAASSHLLALFQLRPSVLCCRDQASHRAQMPMCWTPRRSCLQPNAIHTRSCPHLRNLRQHLGPRPSAGCPANVPPWRALVSPMFPSHAVQRPTVFGPHLWSLLIPTSRTSLAGRTARLWPRIGSIFAPDSARLPYRSQPKQPQSPKSIPAPASVNGLPQASPAPVEGRR